MNMQPTIHVGESTTHRFGVVAEYTKSSVTWRTQPPTKISGKMIVIQMKVATFLSTKITSVIRRFRLYCVRRDRAISSLFCFIDRTPYSELDGVLSPVAPHDFVIAKRGSIEADGFLSFRRSSVAVESRAPFWSRVVSAAGARAAAKSLFLCHAISLADFIPQSKLG